MDVELVLSIVLAGATVCYTIINLMMWFESRATRKQKSTPILIAFLKITDDHKTLAVHLKNVGEGCAKDVSINVLKDYNQFGRKDYPLSECFAFRNGVNIFPAGYELRYYLDDPCTIDYSNSENYIEIEITYKNLNGKLYAGNLFKLPFNQINDNYSAPPESYKGQIPYYLKEIVEIMKAKCSKGTICK